MRLLVLLVLCAGCSPPPEPCVASEWNCPDENAHPECIGNPEPICRCDAGFLRSPSGCASYSHRDCCSCLASRYRISGQPTTDNTFDELCIADADQCTAALENGSTVRTSETCAKNYCAGDCWHLSFGD